MTEERPVIVTFKRSSFYGDFAKVEPKWHVLQTLTSRHDGSPTESKYGTYVAWCGYARSNLLGELTVSKTKTPKKVSETCAKCIAAIAKEEARRSRERARE